MLLDELAELQCIICYDLFSEPVTLYCGHSYCKTCILSFLAKNNKCPQCKTELFQSSSLMVDQSLETLIRKIRQTPQPDSPLHPSVPFTEEELTHALRSLEGQTSDPLRVPGLIAQLHLATRPPPTRHMTTCFSLLGRHSKLVEVPQVHFRVATEVQKHIAFKIRTGIIPELTQKYTRHANFDLLLEFTHSDFLFDHLVSSGKFVGVTDRKVFSATGGFLFEFRGVNYFNADSVSVKAKCLGPVTFPGVYLYDFSLNAELIHRMEPHGDQLRVYWVEAAWDNKTDFVLSEAAEKSLSLLEKRALHFLIKLQKRNTNFYDEIVRDYGLSAVDKNLSIDYRSDTERFLEVLLNIVEGDPLELPRVRQAASLTAKIEYLRNFFDRTRPTSDPLFVFTHSDQSRRDKALHGFFIVLLFMALGTILLMIYGDVDPNALFPFPRQ